MSVRKTVNIAATAFWLTVFLIVGGYYGIRAIRNYFIHSQLEPHVEDYCIPIVKHANDPKVFGDRQFGKFVVIDREQKQIDSVHYELSSDIRASSPDEVGAVVWVYWDELVTGFYTDGGRGYQYVGTATIIDFATSTTVVSEKKFYGSAPPSVVDRGSVGYGDKPAKEISDYLESISSQPIAVVWHKSSRVVRGGPVASERNEKIKKLQSKMRLESRERQRLAEERKRRQDEAERRRIERAKEEKRRSQQRRLEQERRLAEARRKEETLERRRQAELQERRSFNVVGKKRKTLGYAFKVRLNSEKAAHLTSDELRSIAGKVSEDKYYLVWFYLPEMSLDEPAWTVAIVRVGKEIEIKKSRLKH